jgi:arabinogalactan oligomer/maltooligosaccharide transport system permease protein
MSFTDYGIQNLRAGPPRRIGGRPELHRRLSSEPIPNPLSGCAVQPGWAFANVTIQLILGVGIGCCSSSPPLVQAVLPIAVHPARGRPPIIVATVWKNMFDAQNGAINQLLALTGGLVGLPASLFGADWLRQVEDPISFIPLPLAFYAMLVTNTWLGWPLNAVVATGALQSIPGELYEAAEIDGAGRWQQFKNVTLVFLRPAMVPYAIYGFVLTFNLFHLAYFMSAGGPQGRTELLVTQAYRLVNDQRLYGVGACSP